MVGQSEKETTREAELLSEIWILYKKSGKYSLSIYNISIQHGDRLLGRSVAVDAALTTGRERARKLLFHSTNTELIVRESKPKASCLMASPHCPLHVE